MTKKRILICDDSLDIGGSFKNKIEQINAIKRTFGEPILAEELENTIGALELRRQRANDNDIRDYPEDDAAQVIDNATILIIDYALYDLEAPVTGERIAYLARCYSRCGFIVALNQYPPYVEEFFDLTLRGHLESYANLNIPSESLANPGLWLEPFSGFRPWNWPSLINSTDKLERCVAELKGHLDDTILQFFGFEGTRSLTLPRSSLEFLSREKPEEMTFRKFVDSAGSGNGLRGRNENSICEEAVIRIAAARIGSWLEHDILPSQNILVDAPHLVSRFPSLLGSKTINIKKLNATASFSEPSKLGLNPIIEPFRFLRKDWLSRPAWFWNELRDNENIDEVKNPWETRRLERVFCEDICKFEPKDQTREFIADLNSPYSQRYVKQIQGTNYTPMVRFSL